MGVVYGITVAPEDDRYIRVMTRIVIVGLYYKSKIVDFIP